MYADFKRNVEDETMVKITKSVVSFLLYFVKRQWLGFILITISATSASIINNSVWPYMIGILVDFFSTLDRIEENVFIALSAPLSVTLFCWIFMELMQRTKGVLLANVAPKFEANIRMFAFNRVIKHTYEYFTRKHTGAIAHRIDDLPRTAKLIVDDTLTVFVPLVMSIIISSVVISIHSITLAFCFIGWLVIYFSLSVFFCIKSTKYSYLHSAAKAAVQGVIVDSITNHLSIKIFAGHSHELRNVQATQNDEINKYKDNLLYIEKFKILLSIVSILSVVFLFCFAIKLWQLQYITVGDMVFIVNTTMTLMTVIWFAGDEISYMFHEFGICKQSLSLIQESSDEQSYDYSQDLEVTSGKIEFREVSFKYHQNSNLFDKKSILIPGGQKIGLVGFSGSGKTTFTNLLMRLYEISGGTILIDDQDISKVSLQSLRESIAFIPQEPLLFHRSIKDNIRYANFSATDEEVVQAAMRAEAHDFIMQMPDRYDTKVGERGSKLSGGQKQRIAIARAVLKNASIIIMDEATSALDALTEQMLQKTLNNLIANKTVIIIAHRLSTLLRMDRILVFNKGSIIEDGTHNELLAKAGHYAMLWNMQHDGILPESSNYTT